jgi:hypothetical protein
LKRSGKTTCFLIRLTSKGLTIQVTESHVESKLYHREAHTERIISSFNAIEEEKPTIFRKPIKLENLVAGVKNLYRFNIKEKSRHL